jgi:hypothetical protein
MVHLPHQAEMCLAKGCVDHSLPVASDAVHIDQKLSKVWIVEVIGGICLSAWCPASKSIDTGFHTITAA